MDFSDTLLTAQQIVINFGLKLVGAFALWWAGRALINIVLRMVRKVLVDKQLEPTLQRYLASILVVVLNIVLVIGILGFFGFETTSFAALLAAAGVAIGAAWAGLLSNFAAGAFLMVLRPFKVGDHVEAGGVEGVVHEIGLFNTTLTTGDNVPTYVGNAKILGDTMKNFSASPHRRVDRTVDLDRSIHPVDAIALFKSRLAEVHNVLHTPAPEVDILEVSDAGVKLAVRPYCKPGDYGMVLFDTNKAIREVLDQLAEKKA
jgi:small conductance mechanosensitive channel